MLATTTLRLAILALLSVVPALASTTQDDRRRQSMPTNIHPALPPQPTPISMGDDGAVELSESTLLANPELLHHALLSALAYDNTEGVAVLLPIYQKQPADHLDDGLIAWASAAIAKPKDAISQYQALSARYPDNALLSLRLGQAYFANQQYQEAQAIFKAQPDAVQDMLAPYLQHIDTLQKPRIYLTGNYLSNQNINNAPNNADLGGGWTANTPKSAHGLYAHLGLQKRHLLTDGTFAEPQFGLSGKYYWDAKHYNEWTARAALALGKSTADNSFILSPFFEQTYYAGGMTDENNNNQAPTPHHFVDTAGITLHASTTLSPKSALSFTGELGQNHYAERKHLNGYNLSTSPTWHYYYPTGSLSLGTEHQYANTRDKDDSFKKTGVRLAINQQWGNIGAHLSLRRAKRTYLAPMPIFNQIEQNTERELSASLWHTRLHYRGLTPRLTWHYQKTDSNIALRRYQKGQVFIEVSGQF